MCMNDKPQQQTTPYTSPPITTHHTIVSRDNNTMEDHYTPERTDSYDLNSLDGTSSSSSDDETKTKSVSESFPQKRLVRRQSSLQEVSVHLTTGTIVSLIVVLFSLVFPFNLAPAAAVETYKFAFWKYDPALSHFDTTPWTYGTDYFLAVTIMMLVFIIPAQHHVLHNAGWLSRGLLACYSVSVTAGGVAHQFYTTVEMRNTISFRILWTVCVGTVAAASGFMGSTGAELLRLDQEQQTKARYNNNNNHNHRALTIPIIPDWFWIGYAFFVTGSVAAGAFSCHRPACDIFIVGITQFPSTFYMIAILFFRMRQFRHITNTMRFAGCVGFILNAPLLPLYPILVQYTDWSLASVNTLLHSWLWVSWSLQGLCMRHVENAIVLQATTTIHSSKED